MENKPEKIKSWDELKNYRDARRAEHDEEHTVLAVGMATCGVAAGAREVSEALSDEIKKQGLENVSVVATGCYGFCYAEPMVEVRKAGKTFRYGPVDDELARNIVRKHVADGEVLEENLIRQEVERA